MWHRETSPLDLPESNVAIFAFLLNFVWEMWQIPFYEGMPGAPHWEAVWLCTRATIGDVGIMLLAFWSVAAVVRSRNGYSIPPGYN